MITQLRKLIILSPNRESVFLDQILFSQKRMFKIAKIAVWKFLKWRIVFWIDFGVKWLNDELHLWTICFFKHSDIQIRFLSQLNDWVNLIMLYPNVKLKTIFQSSFKKNLFLFFGTNMIKLPQKFQFVQNLTKFLNNKLASKF